MKYDIDFCMKINAEKWVKSLRDGTVCFNPIDFFIKKAEIDGNNEQGDKYEGVFGRLKKDDHRFLQLQNQLGDDLEIIDDGDHVILRRVSARNIPIFCMYGIFRDELIPDPNSLYYKDGEPYVTVKYEFPQKIYQGFLDDDDVWGFYCSSGHLHEKIDESLTRNSLSFRKTKIIYDIDLSEEFLFELNNEYFEITHKRKDLSYQHEIRYYLLGFPRKEKYLLSYTPLSDHSGGIAKKAVYLEMNYKCDILEE